MITKIILAATREFFRTNRALVALLVSMCVSFSGYLTAAWFGYELDTGFYIALTLSSFLTLASLNVLAITILAVHNLTIIRSREQASKQVSKIKKPTDDDPFNGTVGNA